MQTNRNDNATSKVIHNAAALLAKLRDKETLSPDDRAMISIYSSAIDRRRPIKPAPRPARKSR